MSKRKRRFDEGMIGSVMGTRLFRRIIRRAMPLTAALLIAGQSITGTAVSVYAAETEAVSEFPSDGFTSQNAEPALPDADVSETDLNSDTDGFSQNTTEQIGDADDGETMAETAEDPSEETESTAWEENGTEQPAEDVPAWDTPEKPSEALPAEQMMAETEGAASESTDAENPLTEYVMDEGEKETQSESTDYLPSDETEPLPDETITAAADERTSETALSSEITDEQTAVANDRTETDAGQESGKSQTVSSEMQASEAEDPLPDPAEEQLQEKETLQPSETDLQEEGADHTEHPEETEGVSNAGTDISGSGMTDVMLVGISTAGVQGEEDNGKKQAELTDLIAGKEHGIFDQSEHARIDFICREKLAEGCVVEGTIVPDDGYSLRDLFIYPLENGLYSLFDHEFRSPEAQEERITPQSLDILEDGTGTFSFIMPDQDVVLYAWCEKSAGGGMLLRIGGTTNPEAEWGDKGDYQRIPDRYILESSLDSTSSEGWHLDGHGYTRYRECRIRYTTSDGQTTDWMTVTAYCLQASLADTASIGTTTFDESNTYETTRKALLLMSSGVFNSTTLGQYFRDHGVTSDANVFAMQHMIASYAYWMENNCPSNWTWNSVVQKVTGGGPGVGTGAKLNADGEAFVRECYELVKAYGSFDCRLVCGTNAGKSISITQNQVTINGAAGSTPSILYDSIPENALTLNLGNLTLVNETTGERKTGMAVIAGGNRFHLEASLNGTPTRSLSGSGALFTEGESAISASNDKKNQDLGFAGTTSRTPLAVTIDWPNPMYSITIRKLDALTGTVTPSAGYQMAGAVYGIYADQACTSLIEQLTIGPGSTAVSTAQYRPSVTYYVKEITAPAGYAVDTAVHPAAVVSGAVTVTSADTPLRLTISVQKTDSLTGTSAPSSGYQLSGAVYGIYSDSSCSNLLEKVTTNSSGKAVSGRNYLRSHTYYVKEISAPAGYSVDSAVHTVKTDSADVTVASEDVPILLSITVEKRDALTGSTTPTEGYKLSGAVYGIYSDAACTKLLERITTDSSGKAVSGKSYLRSHTYYVKEISAPAGYTIDSAVHTVKTETADITVVSEDAPVLLSITVEKRDALTGSTTPTGGYELSGAVYGIYSDAACTKLLEKITTGSSGKAVSGKNYLRSKTYYVKEITPPDGYDADRTIHTAKMGTENLTVVSTDAPILLRISVQKKDALTGTSVPSAGYRLSGAVYGIYSDSACTKLMERITTDNSGSAVSGKNYLRSHTYYVKEITAAEGYEKDDAVHTAAVSKSDVSVNSSEMPMRIRIGLQKKDKSTGSAVPLNKNYSLAGARYTIYKDQACTEAVESVITAADGRVVSSGLYPIGTYYVKETGAPECGLYETDPAVYTAGIDMNKVKSGSTLLITSAEKPKYGMILVQKTDASTGKSEPQTPALPFHGAVFGIYTDQACTKELTRITTDKNGMAQTAKNLPAADYWVKELQAPAGYLKNETVIHVTAEQLIGEITKKEGKIRLNVPEKVIRGNVAVMKTVRDKNGRQVETLPEGIIFRFTYVRDPSVTFEVSSREVLLDDGNSVKQNVIVTDRSGFATTESSRYPEGSLLYGEWLVEEHGARDGYEPMDPVTINISQPSQMIRLVLDNNEVSSYIKIVKEDANTGSRIPVPGVAFQIADQNGDILSLFDFGKQTYTETWVTDDNGEVMLHEALGHGQYELREISGVPEGYILMDPMTFTVDGGDGKLEEALVLTAKEPVQQGIILVEKTDAETGEKLEGAVFNVICEEDITDPSGVVRTGPDAQGQERVLTAGTVVDTITTDNEGKASTKALYPGKYQLEEIEAPEYHVLSEEIMHAVIEPDTAQADGAEPLKVYVEAVNEATSLQIMKTDADGGRPLAHTVFRIIQADSPGTDHTEPGSEDSDGPGWLCETDETGMICLSGILRHNTRYVIREEAAAPGYVSSDEEWEFSVDENGMIDGNAVFMMQVENQPVMVSVSKQDITGSGEIPGAVLEVHNAEGNLVEEWVSGEEPHLIKALVPGEYTLTETLAPDGYAVSESVLFEVQETGEIQHVAMYDKPVTVSVSKRDITTGEEVPGAKLQIRDLQGELIEEWISGDEPHLVRRLKAGTYTLTEILAPGGYLEAETITFKVEKTGEIQPVIMYDEPLVPTIVHVSKRDITNGEEIPGARLKLLDEAGTVLEEWISTDRPHEIKELAPGTYSLTEILAPDGYLQAETVEFTVLNTGEIQSVIMYDAPVPEEPETETEAATEPQTEPLTEKPTEPVTERQTEAPTELQTERSTEPATEVSTELPTEPVTEKPTEPVTEKQTEAPTEHPTEPETEKLTEPVSETESEHITLETEEEPAVRRTPGSQPPGPSVTKGAGTPRTSDDSEPMFYGMLLALSLCLLLILFGIFFYRYTNRRD